MVRKFRHAESQWPILCSHGRLGTNWGVGSGLFPVPIESTCLTKNACVWGGWKYLLSAIDGVWLNRERGPDNRGSFREDLWLFRGGCYDEEESSQGRVVVRSDMAAEVKIKHNRIRFILGGLKSQ